MKAVIATVAILTLYATSLYAADDEPPRLRHNPFSRPSSEVIVSMTNPIVAESVSTEPLELRATMIGTVNRLANVDGKILRRGDEIQGYVLVAIHERYAVFERNGEETTVYVRPVQTEEQTSPGRRR